MVKFVLVFKVMYVFKYTLKIMIKKVDGAKILLPWHPVLKIFKKLLKSMDEHILILFSPKCISSDCLEKLYKSI